MADVKKTPGMMGGQATLDLVKEIEGFEENAYVDAGGHSIGYGHFIKKGEEHLMTATLTKEQAEEMLRGDIAEHQSTIRKNLKVQVSDQKMAALTSLVYNVGANSKAVKKVIELLNDGREAEVGGVLSQYVKSKNPKTKALEVNPALQARRAFEEKLLTGGDVGDLTKAYRNRNKLVAGETKPEPSQPGVTSSSEMTPLERIVKQNVDQLSEKESAILASYQKSAGNNQDILSALKIVNQDLNQVIASQGTVWGKTKKFLKAVNRVGGRS